MTDPKDKSSTNDDSKATVSDDSKTPLDDIEVLKQIDRELAAKKQAREKSPSSATPVKESAVTKSPATSTTPSQKLSKTAVFAVFLALVAIGGVAGSYWYLNQQSELRLTNALADLTQSQQQAQSQAQQAFQQQLTQQVQSVLTESQRRQADAANQHAKQLVEYTNQAIDALRLEMQQQRVKQPSDWLLNEAEFLIRAANRTLKLDKNITTVTALLTDADARIDSMNDPQYLPLRAAIKQDIESLALLPTLDTDTIILSLMALANQVDKLPLSMVEVPDNGEANVVDNELTENVADWQENLAKSWRRFMEDFITVRRVSGQVTPLMSPQFQANLRQNLALKLQQAQWAAAKESTELYQAILADISQWVNDYFDMEREESQHFVQRLTLLSQHQVAVDYPDALLSLAKVRQKLSQRDKVQPPQAQPQVTPNTEETVPADNAVVESDQ